MSLNGLDDAKVKEAHDAAVAEPGGWYGHTPGAHSPPSHLEAPALPSRSIAGAPPRDPSPLSVTPQPVLWDGKLTRGCWN